MGGFSSGGKPGGGAGLFLRFFFKWITLLEIIRVLDIIESERGVRMSTLSFKAFCIEYYAAHIGRASNEVDALFEQTGLLKLLDEDYEDLHGMSMEYLMQFFDRYLEGAA